MAVAAAVRSRAALSSLSQLYAGHHLSLGGASRRPAVPLLPCRFTQILPDLRQPGHHTAWYRLEVAKRRLLYSLRHVGLPLVPTTDDPAQGLAFALLADPGEPDAGPVLTGHPNGVITINMTETDDVEREQRRQQLHEPSRTLLGHVRHESGHYYWERLLPQRSRLAASVPCSGMSAPTTGRP